MKNWIERPITGGRIWSNPISPTAEIVIVLDRDQTWQVIAMRSYSPPRREGHGGQTGDLDSLRGCLTWAREWSRENGGPEFDDREAEAVLLGRQAG